VAVEKEIQLPDIGDFSSVDVIEILVAEGDHVAKDDSLITLESDKATMEIPSPESGVIQKLLVKVGDKISEGTSIALIMLAESDIAADPEVSVPDDLPEQTLHSAPTEKDPEESVVDDRPDIEEKAAINQAVSNLPLAEPVREMEPSQQSHAHASPAVRRFARELGVDLLKVTGSGRKNRIQKEDVQAYVKKTLTEGPKSEGGAGLNIAPAPAIDFSKFGEIEEQPLGRIKKISGNHLHRSWISVPHVTQFDEADITSLEAFRKDQKAMAEKQGVKLTFMPFLMKAIAATLRQYPQFNSSLSADGEALILKKYVHIGVAVDTPNGLVVPVIRDVDKKGVMQLAAELMEISAKARDGKLAPADMQGGCFSISSLGGIGGTQFTPIVNSPEVAILGVSRADMKPVWNGSEFEAKLIMPFSLSYDHRVIDGAEGVRFTTALSQMLGDLRRLLL
jgi:pyruvate dehydrogenase E2 component (dihydrolipoamide acetyltransferase)